MRILPYLMAAGFVVLGTACSSTNTETGTTATTDSAPGTAAGNTPSTTRMGSDMNPSTTPDANSGMTANGAQTAPTANVMGASGTSASGGDVSADQTAFMNTFTTMKDPAFLLTAASSNMLEIQAGRLAVQRATKPEVKQFGQMMVSHHTKATQDLQGVATPLGVQMPTTLMPVHQAMADKLMSKTGKEFDEAYLDMMETAHKMDIALFEVKSKGAETATVQSFATKTLPMLRSHYSAADKLEDKVD